MEYDYMTTDNATANPVQLAPGLIVQFGDNVGFVLDIRGADAFVRTVSGPMANNVELIRVRCEWARVVGSDGPEPVNLRKGPDGWAVVDQGRAVEFGLSSAMAAIALIEGEEGR